MNPKRVPKTGPRGGTTTISKTGMMRKAVNLHHEDWERLRKRAFEERRPASELVREALRRYFETEEGGAKGRGTGQDRS